MCYAVSTGPDPLGSYYRYEFIRPLFPDYPRPAVWPDGYYVPTSSGDTVIQKQAFVVERDKMLKGEDAREQGVILDGVNFLNCADIDGYQLPPPGAPNIVMAAGGTQLHHVLEDDGIYVWKYHVDWNNPAKTTLEGPEKIPVAPYHYLGGGQLTSCVPQPGVQRRLDAQGDKIMQRLVYRRIGDQQSIVAVHSIATSAGGGGVRWYEFRIDAQRRVKLLYQQGTYAPEGCYRWMASPGHGLARQHRHRLLLWQREQISPASASPAAWRATLPASLPSRKPCWPRARHLKPTPCAGRITRKPPLTRAMIARFGTSAITSEKATALTQLESARFDSPPN